MDFPEPKNCKNPAGPDTGACRVVRGGSWQTSMLPLCSAFRNSDHTPASRAVGIGFRVVRGSR
ncbi:MAG: formylglycine-generating enzyme family protein [Treponema sp.]|nr:formylglycine-generating enzyme family protein [Treponema sp.]